VSHSCTAETCTSAAASLRRTLTARRAAAGLSNLTWVLPDRFGDNELALEGLHTGVNLLSALHSSLVDDLGPAAPRGAGELTFALAALQQVEVLVELWALRARERGTLASRYDPLIVVEAAKALVRLAILRKAGGRILLGGGAAAFEAPWPADGGDDRAQEVFAAFAAFRQKHCYAAAPENGAAPPRAAAGRTGDGRAAAWWEGASAAELDLGPSAAHAAAVVRALEAHAAARQAAAARLVTAGELVHILRPLLYVAALRHWRRRSWKPWALALAFELAGARLTAAGAAASRAAAAEAAHHAAVAGTSLAPLFAMQALRWRRDEAQELTRRKLQLLYYLARDPLFGRLIAPAVARWQRRLARVPLLGWAAERAGEVALGAQSYFTYTSAS
jgi:hypothetical protein